MRDGKAPVLPLSGREGDGISEAIASVVGKPSNAELWILLEDDGTPHPSLVPAIRAWRRAHGEVGALRELGGHGVRWGTWSDWRAFAEVRGLGEFWDALAAGRAAPDVRE